MQALQKKIVKHERSLNNEFERLGLSEVERKMFVDLAKLASEPDNVQV